HGCAATVSGFPEPVHVPAAVPGQPRVIAAHPTKSAKAGHSPGLSFWCDRKERACPARVTSRLLLQIKILRGNRRENDDGARKAPHPFPSSHQSAGNQKWIARP